jgi:hypothetical protein
LIRGRIKAAGERVGVKVYPHRLRHTAATQLLNAGCRVTSIQKFLGHKKLNTTMIYARVHDQTVADDYYAAMSQVEKRLELLPDQENSRAMHNTVMRNQLLELTTKLAEPDVDREERINLAIQIRHLILGIATEQTVSQMPINPELVSYFSD